MRVLRRLLDRARPHFEEGGRLQRAHPLFEAVDTILFTPSTVTTGPTHVRDALNLKRMMFIVVIALLPCVAMAMYNTGLQAHLAIAQGATPLPGWRTAVYEAMGLGYAPGDILGCFVHGALYFVPIFVVGFAAGGAVEVLNAIVRGGQVEEGFFVTGFLIPLILPATIPLWQVAVGVAFGVLVGKEIFGGTGMNVLNPALTARAFLFFAYPAQISGNVWTPATVDAVSSATPLAALAEGQTLASFDWWDAALGLVPGSMGETSLVLCGVGAIILLLTQVASWRIMLGVVLGTLVTAMALNIIGSATNPMMNVPAHWHFVLGGWAFGAVFMATDPVTASTTRTGRLVYGFLIGVLAVLIRCVNPAYPEGMMLAILFMNLFAPLIDHLVARANIRRRRSRYAPTR